MANEMNWNALDPVRSGLRTLVARVDTELSSLPGVEATARVETQERLAIAWKALVAELALGEEPVVRRCPHCRHFIRREATRCRYCMNRSEPDA